MIAGTKRTLLGISAAIILVCVAAFAQSVGDVKPSTDPAEIAPTTPAANVDFKNTSRGLQDGQRDEALLHLQKAAERGHVVAQWQLASMYASGNRVPKNESAAHELFQLIVSNNSEIPLRSPSARFVSNSYVMLSKYYRSGALAPKVPKNPEKARDLLTYAASYFADADAQYLLGKMYIEGEGGPRNPLTALRWLKLSAKKGNVFAQTTFGHLLFNGMDKIKPDRVQGLAWMTIAHNALQTKPGLAVTHLNIITNYEWANALATNEERAAAARLMGRVM